MRRGPIPFNSKNMQLTADGFKEDVERGQLWGLATLSRVLKEHLRVWKRDIFRNIDLKKMVALKKALF